MLQLQKMMTSSIPYRDVQICIETITPTKAKEYLSKNFQNNRRPAPRAVEQLTQSILDDKFYLSWDCLAFNDQNLLVNGQHRLNAVVNANVACPFFVIRNIPHNTVQSFDSGKKRTQADRISVGGTPMHGKSCSIIKLALSDFNAKFTGTGNFGYLRFDDLIADLYKRHYKFFEKLEEDGFYKTRYINNTLASAFKIFLEMSVGKLNMYKNRYEFPYDMTPYERTTLWIQLVTDGYSENVKWNPVTDIAPIKLKEYLVKRRDRNETMYGAIAFKYYTLAANQFMRGKMTKDLRLDTTKNDPFSKLKDLESSNNYLL